MDLKIKVKKRDNTLQDYDPKKIERVSHAAGVDAQTSQKIAGFITDWLRESQIQVSISSLKLRDLVATELKKVNDNAYNLYVWYEQTKDGVK